MSQSHQAFKPGHGSEYSISECEPAGSPSSVTSADSLAASPEAKKGNSWVRNNVAPAVCCGIGAAGLVAVGLPALIAAPAVGVAGIAAHAATAGSVGQYAFIMFCSGAGAAVGFVIEPWLRTKTQVGAEGPWYRFVGKRSSRKAGYNDHSG